MAITINVSDLDGSQGFVLKGVDISERSGYSVSDAGDLNGDGIDDIVIGSPGRGYTRGGSPEGVPLPSKAYVVFGDNDGFDADLNLETLDGSNGFVFTGIYNSRISVDNAGDFNGDGFEDLIIGVSNRIFNYENTEESYIIFGSSEGFAAELDLANFALTNGIIIENDNDGSNFAFSVSSAGDINNDGFDDVVIGASGVDPNGRRNAGESYVIFGFDASEIDKIVGTEDDDVLSGTNADDIILGLGGADTILGAAGDDILRGGRDSDTILGGVGNDIISGGLGNDFLRGNFADDTISGNLGADVIWGDFGNDELIGRRGNDTLIGGRGNDSLDGNRDNDRLIGVDTININSNFGRGEIDTLTGGTGSDIFVLGNSDRVFYNDGDILTSGEADLAIIKTLNTNRDTIQLRGSAELYRLDFFASGADKTDARLIYDPGVAAIGEAIAILEDVDPNLSVDDSVFTFV